MSTAIQQYQHDFYKTLQVLHGFENSLNREITWPCESCDDDEKGLWRYDDCEPCESELIKRTMTEKTVEVFNGFKTTIREMLDVNSSRNPKGKIQAVLVESNILLAPLRDIVISYCLPSMSEILNEKFFRPDIKDSRTYSLFDVAVLQYLNVWCRYRKLESRIYDTRISIVRMMLASGANPGTMGIVKHHEVVNRCVQVDVTETSLTLVNRAKLHGSYGPIIELLEEASKKDDEAASTSTALANISPMYCQKELLESSDIVSDATAGADIVPPAVTEIVPATTNTAVPLLLAAITATAMVVSGKLFKS